jgi:Niemann-Pick C1 protein
VSRIKLSVHAAMLITQLCSLTVSALFIMISVMLTVIDLTGLMYYYGLTIEFVTAILMILSCGLALDYSAHIGVAYMSHRGGTRQERAIYAVSSVGSAIFHGGFSSFIAICALGVSNNYIFFTFFSVLTTVIFTGLYHGLIFLPCILAIMGPEPSKP